MFEKGILLKDIHSDDKKCYVKDSKIQITPLGIYVIDGSSFCGWIYKNVKNRIINNKLKENIDYRIN